MAASIRVTSRFVTAAKSAPPVPTARRMDDLVQAGLLACGSIPSPPSQVLHGKTQWHVREGFAADSCGGKSGFALPLKRRSALDSPWPINVIGTPELWE